jgi:PfaB family protein
MIAVIGMDAQFGGQANIDRVERAFYQGLASRQSALSEPVAFADLCQASVERMAKANKLALSDINVLIVGDNVVDLAGGLSAASEMVDQGKIVAIVGANLSTTPLDSHSDSANKATISFDKNFEAYQAVEGVAAVLLAPESIDQYVYSYIKGFNSGDNIKTVTNAALAQANVGHDQVNLLEVSALADSQQATRERSGLIEAYTGDAQLHTAVSCARSVTGEGGAFSQVAGLLKCVMSLHQRYIPAINDWYKCDEGQLASWQNSPFYFPVEARPWFPNSDGKAHLAAYSCMSDTSYCHVVLAENQLAEHDVRKNGFMACSDLRLVILKGNSESELLAKMVNIEQSDSPLQDIALNSYQDYISVPKADYCLSLIAESTQALHKEIQQAKKGLPTIFADPSVEWETPKGSYFSAKPIKDEGNDSNVAFLYPGIGATYLGLGRDLFHLFPQIVPPVIALADDIGQTLKDTQLYPRSVQRLNVKALGMLDLKLRGELANIAECGVGFACIFTKVFEQVFDVKADYATGYSMGEVSMYAALGCWQQPGLLSARLAQSDTFNHQLCGELRTLREYWGMPDIEDGNARGSSIKSEKIWETYTVKTTMDRVSIALEGEDRVFCTIVNTPDSLLFGGYPADVERVIEKMGVWSMPLNMANAIHSAPAQLEYDKIVDLHTMDVTNRINTKMYSSSCYLPIPQRSKAIAHSVAKCLCDPVDFPRLINTLHDKGARVFVEMGPGLSLCRWVGRILNHVTDGVEGKSEPKAHLAVPVNAKGTPDELTYLRAVAKLASYGVELNLTSLFHGSIIVPMPTA